MLDNLEITRVAESRIGSVDFENLGFGNLFSDHMFSMRYEGGAWREPRILPYGPISIDPANATLQYAQSVFEGLKAFRGVDGKVRVFRPDMNLARMRTSCERICIPPPDEAMFMGAIEHLVALDQAFIPSKRGQALYIRPIVFSDEGHLEVRPSTRYRFLVMTGPVRAYFDASMAAVALKVEERQTRAAPGGVGFAKTGGNYAASLRPGESARAEGYAQVLWLDGVEHRYVEEVGAMNIFFRIDDTVVTPALQGTILPGVTRDSVLTLLRDRGIEVEERRIALDEIVEASRRGRLREAFGAGTAAIIAPVGRIACRGEELVVANGESGTLTRELYEAITGIQRGEVEDRHGWNRLIDIG
ncbi:MAG: branched-chain amino acid aminotransferase [Ectothiorhodospiraceae bacterium]|nr:branched-chain amino acid aminotransferase [Ectothiorhodospiraceae bacterium]